MKTIYVIAGEVSGDLHASNLITKLVKKSLEPIRFVGMGGEKMHSVGMDLHFDYKDIAIMGFWEVLKQAKRLKQKIKEVVSDIKSENPDALLLVDSSGFNLRVAKEVKKQTSIPIHYYIAPKIWAWAEWRIKKIKERVDFLYCILPFEEEYFRSKGFGNAFYVGNPTLEEIEAHQFEKVSIELKEGKTLALLPGSRKQEISRILPVMLETAKNLNYENVAIACTDNFNQDFYTQFVGSNENVKLVYGQAWNLLNQSDVALVTSGTATLETALIGCPQIVLYKTSPLSYTLGKKLIKVKHISLVNLILNRGEVVELIQNDVTVNNICKSIGLIQSKQAKLVKNELKLVLGNSKSKVEQFSFLV